MGRFHFPPWMDRALPWAGALLAFAPIYLAGVLYYGGSPQTTHLGYSPDQPVPFSHEMHAGQLGLDCRYCHVTVEKAAHAAVPPTSICMNCHAMIATESDQLAPVRASFLSHKNEEGPEKGDWLRAQHASTPQDKADREVPVPLFRGDSQGPSQGSSTQASSTDSLPIDWVRVHDLPDFVFFDHSAHVTKGVSCVQCHGRVDKMARVTQVEPLSMGWCLECHRQPEGRIWPPERVTDLDWTPDESSESFLAANPVNPSTDCSTCHR